MKEAYLKKLPATLQNQFKIFWQDYQANAQHTDIQSIKSNKTVWQSLPLVSACSHFISRICLCRPDYLSQFANETHPRPFPIDNKLSHELQQSLANCDNDDALLTNLRQFRQKYMLRIAWYDFADWASVEQSLAALSDLADVLVDSVNQYYYTQLSARFGQPCDKTGQAIPLLIVGMGKLGGKELNFSSDIDLIFIYPESGQTNGKQRQLDNHTFFNRLGQKIIHSLNTLTADGFVYRVDMRLRPFGDSGALVISFDALEQYYQSHAREWERYAWIKGRVISGGADYAEQLYQRLRPFIYRRYLDFSAFEGLRDLKLQIDQAVKEKFNGDNIKLGRGGIREIEFIAQAFQLIRGGRQPSLQQRSLLIILNELKNQHCLKAQVIDELRTAYLFLRHLENHLQAIDDQQTQLLPTDALNQSRLAHSLGYPDWQACTAAWRIHQDNVAKHFQDLIFLAETPQSDIENRIKRLWINSSQNDSESLAQALRELGFQDSDTLAPTLQYFQNNSILKRQSAQGRQRLDKLMPQLLAQLRQQDKPAILLERLIGLLNSIAQRSVYLALLGEQAPLLAHVIQLYRHSIWLATQINRYPLLLDELLGDRLQSQAQMQTILTQRLSQIPADDLELQMDILRHFKRAQVVQIAADELSGQLETAQVSDELSQLADTLLNQILKLAWQQLSLRYGEPCYQDSDSGTSQKAGFCIIAYGKAGSQEMSYHSDLDIIFLHNSGKNGNTNGKKTIDNTVFFTRLINRITHLISTRTGSGRLYETDFRLRPEGNAGLLVSHINAFNDYQHHKAWTWEHQALIRARPICGDPKCQQSFIKTRQQIIRKTHDISTLTQEVSDMRTQMRTELDKSNQEKFDLKQGEGGLSDIEFLVQYWVLKHGAKYPELADDTGVHQLLQQLTQKHIIKNDWANQLSQIYYRYRAHINKLTLQQQSSQVTQTEFSTERAAVKAIWQQVFKA